MHQFCYASQTTSSKANLLDDLTTILSQARNFNHRHCITGALYFADGYFFQCLEGEKNVLNALFNKLTMDKRHHRIHVFEMREIEHRCFENWDMKYISKRDSIHALCQSFGFDAFKPHDFNQDHVDALLKQLTIQTAAESHEEKV